MITLLSPKQHWCEQDFSKWIETYRQSLPAGERILVALKDPFHQLAALYAGLIEGRRVLSASLHLSSLERENLNQLFLPDATIETPVSFCDQPLSKELHLDRGLLGIATSGSSGKPKIVLHRPRSLMASAQAYCRFYDIQQDDRLASPLPLHHIGGLMPFWRALVSKTPLILPTKSWQEVFDLNPTHVSLVPTQLLTMLDQNFDWSKLKCVLMGAQALDPNLFQRAVSAGAPLSVSYGSSESAAQLCGTLVNTDPQGSVGIPLEQREIRIINDRIAFKGNACFWGYQVGPHDSMPFNSDGYFLTEDLGRFDEQGRLYILGRADHIFKCGGENVNPSELEQLISDKLGFEQVIVLPTPDHQFGNLATAFISPFGLETMQRVRDFNHKLAAHHKIRHVRGDFPHSSGIKVSRTYAIDKMKDKLAGWNLQRYQTFQKGKPDMVFLHGFMGTHASMQAVADSFSHKFNVWGLDLPYHGQHINLSDDFTHWDHVIDELAFVLMRFSRLWLYGYSMGGRLALGLRSRYPQLAEYIIVEGAHPGLATNEQRQQRAKEEKATIQKMNNFPNFLQQWYRAPLFSLNDADIEPLINSTAPTPQLYAQALASYGLSQQPDLSQAAQAPNVLSVAGQKDQKYCQLMHQPIIIPEVGHKASYQAPQVVHELVLQQIARLGWHL